jgi:hypothetical protein
MLPEDTPVGIQQDTDSINEDFVICQMTVRPLTESFEKRILSFFFQSKTIPERVKISSLFSEFWIVEVVEMGRSDPELSSLRPVCSTFSPHQ